MYLFHDQKRLLIPQTFRIMVLGYAFLRNHTEKLIHNPEYLLTDLALVLNTQLNVFIDLRNELQLLQDERLTIGP